MAQAVRADGTLVLVVGAEGEPAYRPLFTEWADRWVAAAGGAMRVEPIGRDSVPATLPSTNPAATQPQTDKDRLRDVIAAAVGEKASPLWIVLIGHGTAQGQDAKFNLRGPDVSDQELAQWLRPATRPVVLINCASSSGPFVNRLSGENRVVITATRNGSEYQFARFGAALSAAITNPAADLDKDGQTSLFEAFLVASRQTDAFYQQAGRLTTEHALLDDNGDRLGVSADWFDGFRPKQAARQTAAVDGEFAARLIFRPNPQSHALSPEQLRRRQQLEADIDALRRRKATLVEADYYAELERLMLPLAELYQ
ncbi:MAG: hypothetical protein QM754_09350 [Tepidisphaeraceae bacterium]